MSLIDTSVYSTYSKKINEFTEQSLKIIHTETP